MLSYSNMPVIRTSLISNRIRLKVTWEDKKRTRDACPQVDHMKLSDKLKYESNRFGTRDRWKE